MNIRAVLPQVVPTVSPNQKTDSDVSLRTGNTAKDKEGQNFQEKKDKRRFLSDEEFQRALEYLRNIEAVKTNFWVVDYELVGTTRVVSIKDTHGKIIRRITELDLSTLVKEPDRPKGQLFDKAG